MKYRVKRADRASNGYLEVGTTLYPGRDCYGCANDDTRRFDLEYIAVSLEESGEPFFTIPREDVERIP